MTRIDSGVANLALNIIASRPLRVSLAALMLDRLCQALRTPRLHAVRNGYLATCQALNHYDASIRQMIFVIRGFLAKHVSRFPLPSLHKRC